ncbi:hypothetical protein SAMN04489812_3970 [Microlunatus soli]|uniref:AAA domain-containing protein n=2 Tax=Microlunatus soli TaxID=630515 RepID=A0A1H1X851_9ACTN|nr:hypothetical protein SAMN04489812_3970 [Microlunatus soli]
MSALLPLTPGAAKIDAEDVGQVNPFTFDQRFLEMLWSNVIAVIQNFWSAGYSTVITGSLLDGDSASSLQDFRSRLPDDIALYVVRLHAAKPVRDRRRIDRPKPSSRQWRDQVDAAYAAAGSGLHEDAGDHRLITVDNSDQHLHVTIAEIRARIPEIYT